MLLSPSFREECCARARVCCGLLVMALRIHSRQNATVVGMFRAANGQAFLFLVGGGVDGFVLCFRVVNV